MAGQPKVPAQEVYFVQELGLESLLRIRNFTHMTEVGGLRIWRRAFSPHACNPTSGMTYFENWEGRERSASREKLRQA